jgi:hypothetical protein
MRTLTALTITLLALGAAACGDDAAPPTAKPAAPAKGMPVSQYTNEVDGLQSQLSDTRSEYFHGGNSKAEIRRTAASLQKALTEAATRLEAVEPPATATTLHGQIIALWKQRAGQLQKLLDAKPFKTRPIDDFMAEMDHDTLTDEVYTLPAG